LVKEFGTERIDKTLLERFERVTKHPVPHWLRRGIYFSHRGLNQVLDAIEAGRPVFLYTGRGPSTPSMHLGHHVPFAMTLALQKILGCLVVIQIADDEEQYFKRMSAKELELNCLENIRQIWAMGFDPDHTHVFRNSVARCQSAEFQDVVHRTM
jgi:tryptophanyl-tRNA synthetase